MWAISTATIFGDWAIGIPRYDVPLTPPLKTVKNAGQVKIISGNNGAVLAHVEGNIAGDGFGTALAGNADVNGDGFMDVVVGTPKADDPLDKQHKDIGAITVMYGCAGIDCVATATIQWDSTPKTGFGTAVALGDVNNDGKADVVVGAPKVTNRQGEKPLKHAGRVIVFSGVNLSSVPSLLIVYGQTAGALAGTAVAAGNFNGTGGAEVIVGAPKDDDTTALPKPIKDAGSVTVYTYGKSAPFYTQYGAAAGDAFGQALAVNSGVNNDRWKDVLVGVPGLDDPVDKKLKDVGGAVVLYGVYDYGYGEGSRGPDLLGTEAAAKLGAAVALGDVNADGYVDIIVGAPKGDSPTVPKATKDTGSVQVFSGNGFTALGNTQYGAAKGDAFGTSLSAGDINGDGRADIIVGIPGKDVMFEGKLQKDAGSVRVINATAL